MRKWKTWKFIRSSLHEQVPVMLLYVLESRGSSPGRGGFCMAVNAKGEMEGSIGGGIMEHKWVEVAKEWLREGNAPESFVKKQFHRRSAERDQSGMICSGEQTILLFPLPSSFIGEIDSLLQAAERSEPGILQLAPGRLKFIPGGLLEENELEYVNENEWTFREPTGPRFYLSIIGGGHCSLALSQLFSGMDCYIRVFDDRPDLKTLNENPYADETRILSSYLELAQALPVLPRHYVVVMTFGYRTDDLVLRALYPREFTYLGLLGSANKIAMMMEAYEKENFDPAWLKKIHAPIGLPIHSQTPEEIAISIAAEIIREKNRPRE